MNEESFESFKKRSQTWCFDHCKPSFDIFCQAVLRTAKLLCLIKFVHGMISSSRRVYCVEMNTISLMKLFFTKKLTVKH